MALWVFIGIIALLILLPLIMGLLMAPLQRATRVELIRAPLDVVWESIADLPRQTQWRSDLKNVQFKDDDQGIRWIEHSSSLGKVTVRKKFEDEHRELILLLEKGTLQGKRHIRVAGVPGGTRLTINEERTIPSPLGRLTAKIDKQVNQYISDLESYFANYSAQTHAPVIESEPEPIPAPIMSKEEAPSTAIVEESAQKTTESKVQEQTGEEPTQKVIEPEIVATVSNESEPEKAEKPTAASKVSEPQITADVATQDQNIEQAEAKVVSEPAVQDVKAESSADSKVS